MMGLRGASRQHVPVVLTARTAAGRVGQQRVSAATSPALCRPGSLPRFDKGTAAYQCPVEQEDKAVLGLRTRPTNGHSGEPSPGSGVGKTRSQMSCLLLGQCQRRCRIGIERSSVLAQRLSPTGCRREIGRRDARGQHKRCPLLVHRHARQLFAEPGYVTILSTLVRRIRPDAECVKGPAQFRYDM